MTTAVDVQQKKLFINNAWCDPRSGKAFKVINPATEDVIAEVAEGNEQDADAAVQAARKAFDGGKWSKMNSTERGRILWKLGDLLTARLDEFAMLETLNCGKPISESKNIEIPMSADVIRYYAGWTNKIYGDTIPTRPGFFNYTLREPIGVVAAITPWNFPLLLGIWKVAPALAAGNTVVWKPASWTPLTTLKFAELCQEAGIPEGVLNVVTGPGSSLGMALVRHPMVDKVAFTGETSTGQVIAREATATLKKVTLELGGKSPNIVFADADLEGAARGAITGIFYNKGEVCCAGSRLFVEESVHDALMEKVIERAKKIVPGDPLNPKTRLGPLTSQSHLKKVMDYIDSGRKEGAKLVAGGDRPAGKGYYLNPTVFDGVKNSMKIAREEIFGPVLAAIPFKDFNDVIAQSNDTFYGLAAGVWSRDIKKAHRAAQEIKAGTVWINTYNLLDTTIPFGGYKMSGTGRELGREALDSYTQVKSVWVDLNG